MKHGGTRVALLMGAVVALTRAQMEARSEAAVGGAPAPQSQAKPEGGADAIRPFHVHFSDEALADMKRRIAATRWPDKETVADQIAGRAARDDAEARALLGDGLRLAQVRGEAQRAARSSSPTIDGLDIHFIHVRSKQPNALPLIVTHGWPGSIIEQLKIIDPLTESDGARRDRGRTHSTS